MLSRKCLRLMAKPRLRSSCVGKARSTVAGTPLGADELRKIDAFWRASNYLALGMTYLKANPLLEGAAQAGARQGAAARALGASPGLAFAYIHA